MCKQAAVAIAVAILLVSLAGRSYAQRDDWDEINRRLEDLQRNEKETKESIKNLLEQEEREKALREMQIDPSFRSDELKAKQKR
jgi:cell division protein FtsL